MKVSLMRFSDFSLPLENPVLIFSLILFIILFAPIILNKFKIPYLIGLIIAGTIIGPNGLNIMLRDSSIILFGTVGLFYIMFLAGLEIDRTSFKKNSGRSLVFGLYTFIIPMGLGFAVMHYLLLFELPTAILISSMFASHTLIAYPIVSKLGISKNRAVAVTAGGTLITDTLALLVLAVIVGMSTGEVNNDFWIRLGISITVFGLVVMILFPIIGRWFFKRYDDRILKFIFVLAMMYFGAFLAEAAGIEGIIGAFLAGLALNRIIPHTSPLMNRIEFVGNALFIPFFLIGVGMLVDFRVFFRDIDTIKVAVAMVTVAVSAKFIAAWLAQQTFRYSTDERRLIFGLSNAQAAATLAVVLVGYNIILNAQEVAEGVLVGIAVEPVRLLNESILNGTIIMILVTCTIASLVTQKGAQNIALAESLREGSATDPVSERILIPVSKLETTEELVNFSITIKSKRNKTGLYALHVLDREAPDSEQEKKARQLLEKAAVTASASDNYIHELLQFDFTTLNGIVNIVREHQMTDLVMGLHRTKDLSDHFLGSLIEGILMKCNITSFIYRSAQPFNTIKRYLVVVPEKAEKEIGFPFWLTKVWNIGRNTGAKLMFYAPKNTLHLIRDINTKLPIESEFIEFTDWEDFLILARDLRTDDCLMIVTSRKDGPSYHQNMAKIPQYVDRYFQSNNVILVIPMQMQVSDSEHVDMRNPSLLDSLEKLDDIGRTIAGMFKKK